MNYELAKELKEAGFPQHPLCNNECMGEGDIGVDMCVPTLSELIEACGYSFMSVQKHHKKLGPNGQIWAAQYRVKPAHYWKEWGDTPEEAVARLWLALKKV